MIKVLVTILAIVFILGGGLLLLIKISTTPIDKDKAREIIKNLIIKDVEKSKAISGAMVLIHSDKLKLHESHHYEKDNNGEVIQGSGEQPFHIASIGKTFTAVLVAKLQEAGKLNFNDPITSYLDQATLKDLFVFEGQDYQSEVTIEQLLGHTSGVADYFEDRAKDSKTMAELILTEPERMWTPSGLLDFTRDHQQAVSKPGASFHYSDTGYILLGLLIEKITNQPFHENLKEMIFSPLQMEDSYLMFYGEPARQPKKAIAKIWFNGKQVSTYTSLSVDWAGGGIVSTTDDLLKFMQALRSEQLVNATTLAKMENFQHKFRQGIHYGLGMMQYRFEEFFPLLKSYPRMTGHMGILSTHMFYADIHDVTIICNYGSDRHIPGSVKAIIQIVGTLDRIK